MWENVWEQTEDRYGSTHRSQGQGRHQIREVRRRGRPLPERRRRESKSWLQRIVIDGRRRDIGLGGYPAVGLAEAQGLAVANRTAIAGGHDPVAEKRRPATPTFREAARQVHQANLPRWRNRKHAAWLKTLEHYAFPIMGNLPVDRVGRLEVLGVLTPNLEQPPGDGQEGPAANPDRDAVGDGPWLHREQSCGGAIDGALPPMPKLTAHMRALPFEEVGAALEVVEASRASRAAKLCLRFTLLTAARSGETRGARWSEIEVDKALWTVPGERMKGGREHRVPLSGAALAVLAEAGKLRDGSDLVFPSPTRPGQALSDMTLTKILRSTGLADRATVHGFRSSFRDWADECTGASEAAMELSLAHRGGSSVKKAYARTDLLDPRRPLMEEWAEYVTSCPASAESG